MYAFSFRVPSGPRVTCKESLAEDTQHARRGEYDHACDGNADDPPSQLRTLLLRIQETVRIEPLGRMCDVRHAEIAGKEEDKEGDVHPWRWSGVR